MFIEMSMLATAFSVLGSLWKLVHALAEMNKRQALTEFRLRRIEKHLGIDVDQPPQI